MISSPTNWLQATIVSLPQTIPVTFVFNDASDLLVQDSKSSPPTTLILGSDYTVSGGSGSTGNIQVVGTGTNAVLPGNVITISRNVPLTQTTSFTTGGMLNPVTIENALDKLTEEVQQVSNGLSRALQFQNDETLNGVLDLNQRKNKYLGFDSSGNISYLTGSSGGSVSYPITVAQGGTNATTASAARTNLGLGTMSTQNASAVAITGGTSVLSVLQLSDGTGYNGLMKIIPATGYATGGSITLRPDIATNVYIPLTTNPSFAISGQYSGAIMVLTLKNTTASSLTLSWPAWNATGDSLPATLAAGAAITVRIECYGTTVSDVYAQYVSSSGGGGTSTTAVANITALKALSVPAANTVVFVEGYTNAGDGGGGAFYWDSTTTDSDNGGTIIQITATSTGRFRRITASTNSSNTRNTTLDVRWFGAIPDYATDCSTAVNSAYAALPSIGTLYFPAGNYLFSAQVSFTSGKTVTVKGDGVNTTKFIYSNSAAAFHFLYSTDSVSLYDFSVVNIYTRVTNNYIIFFITGASLVMRNVSVSSCDNIIICKYAPTGGGGYIDLQNFNTTSSVNSGSQLWIESAGGTVNGCALSAGNSSGISSNPCFVSIATSAGGGSQTSLRVINCSFKGNGQWGGTALIGGSALTIDSNTMYATCVVSGYYGPNHEGMFSNCLIDTTSGSGNAAGSVCLLLDGRVNAAGGDVSGWNINTLYCNGGRYGIVLYGSDSGSVKNVYSINMSNIYTLPQTGSDGVRFDQCEMCVLNGIYTLGNGGGNGVKFVAGGSNPTRAIDVSGGILSAIKQPTTYGAYFDGSGCQKISVAARIDSPVTSAYVLANSASKSNGLSVMWPKSDGTMNFSSTFNTNV